MLSLLVDCQYPRWINVFATFYSYSLLLLFANFYRQAYSAQAKRSKDSQPLSSSSSSVLGSVMTVRKGVSDRPHAD